MIAGVGIYMIGVAVPRDIVSQLTEPTLNVAFAYADNGSHFRCALAPAL